MESGAPRVSVTGRIANSPCSCSRYRMHDVRPQAMGALLWMKSRQLAALGGKDRSDGGTRGETCRGGRRSGGGRGLLMLHLAAPAVQPRRQWRVDWQFDQARAVPADFRRCDACLSRLRLLAGSARAPSGLRGRRGVLPAIAQQSCQHRARCRDAPCGGGCRFRLPRPPHPHLTTGDNHMVKLLFGAVFGAFSAQYSVTSPPKRR